MNRAQILTVKLLLILVLPGLILAVGCSNDKDWRTASRESAGIAPDPARTNEAILQIYGAKAWGWRGWFAIHTWIAAKHTSETSSWSAGACITNSRY